MCPSGEKGVTMLELMVALFAAGAVLLGLGYLFGLNYNLWQRGQAKVILHARAARALEEMGRSISYASGYTLADGALHVLAPAFPFGDSGAAQTVFRLRENRLLRDNQPFIPLPGDSALGVAAFEPDTVVDGNGGKVLRLRLALYTRGRPAAPAETLHFETLAHARNEGLGLGIGTGGESGASGSAGPELRF